MPQVVVREHPNAVFDVRRFRAFARTPSARAAPNPTLIGYHRQQSIDQRFACPSQLAKRQNTHIRCA